MNKLDEIYAVATNPTDFAKAYLEYVSNLIASLDPAPIAGFIEALEKTRNENRQIFFLGNGGSAATSSHFANDILAGPRSWDKPYRAISLTDNVALLTALGNDCGYDKVFSLQLKALMNAGDLVVGISASGNSPNVINAITLANEKGGRTVGLTGFDGGRLAKLAHIHIHVPTRSGEYGPVEDAHMVVDHLVSAFLMRSNQFRLSQAERKTS